MRPKPLIPTRTGMSESLPGRGREKADSRRQGKCTFCRLPAADDLDPQTVRVAQVSGVVAASVLGPQARSPVVGAAVRQARGMSGVDRRLAIGLQGDVAITGRGRPSTGDDPELRTVDAV